MHTGPSSPQSSSPRRPTARSVVVALVAAALVAATVVGPSIPGVGAQPAPPEDAEQAELMSRLEAAADGPVEVDVDPVTGAVTFVGTEPGAPIRSPEGASGSAEAAAQAFVDEFGALFGAASPAELEREATVAMAGGGTSVTYRQVVGDVPVMAGELRVQVDAAGDVASALGELQPGISGLDTAPTVTAEAAASAAVEAIAKARDADTGALTVSAPSLEVYAPDLLGGAAVGPPLLVWRLEVTGTGSVGPIDELVLVDAATGVVALHFDQVAHGRERQVCDQGGVVEDPPVACTDPVRVEGSGPSGNADADAAYTLSGVTYDFFLNRFGRDGIDGAGAPLVSIVNHCNSVDPCPMREAYWYRGAMYYGSGFASADDVVAHELTHGIIDDTAQLFYWYQSGAINESMADVFGELVDQTNVTAADTGATIWDIGEDLAGPSIRNMRNPGTFLDPDRMSSANYALGPDDNGGVHSNSGVGNKAASLITEGGWFRSIHVTGLGITRAARVYYQALTTMLGSGSDYADLYRALPQSCDTLIGVDGITASDCDQVSLAVEAVEMYQTRNVLAGPAPGCPPLTNALPVHHDDFEFDAGSRWRMLTTAGSLSWNLAGTGGRSPYATSGVISARAPGWAVPLVQAMRTANPIHLPPWPSVLTFNHAFGMEWGRDYGTVEYSIDGGATWFDAGPLFTHGGYNQTVLGDGRPAFSHYSGGYASSQLDLRSLADENLLLQFVYTADASIGSAGWWIDDLRIDGCVSGTSRPDALLRAPGSTSWIGNDTYNATGTGQGRSANVPAAGSATFTARFENDGEFTEPLVIRGPDSNTRFKVTYLAGSTDVTEQVVAGTYQTPPLAPGERSNLKIVIKAKARTPAGATTTVVVKASSSVLTEVKDAVRATVTRVR